MSTKVEKIYILELSFFEETGVFDDFQMTDPKMLFHS